MQAPAEAIGAERLKKSPPQLIEELRDATADGNKKK
jgi:hypothetical protein